MCTLLWKVYHCLAQSSPEAIYHITRRFYLLEPVVTVASACLI